MTNRRFDALFGGFTPPADGGSVTSALASRRSILNLVLDDASKGNGTLGKLIHDEKLYDELVETNNELQNLVLDISVHPERYIQFSLIGRKTKGVPLSAKEEIKLINLFDSIPD